MYLQIKVTEDQYKSLIRYSEDHLGEVNISTIGRIIIQEKINQLEQMRIIDSLPQDNVRIVNENSEH